VASGTALLGLVNRLIDVSKNEAGRADWLDRAETASRRPSAIEPKPDGVTALGADTRDALRAALTLGDIDAAREVLVRLDAREFPVVLDLRRRLDDFDLEGLLACL